MRFIALDTETTGMNFRGSVCKNHRIIEIACIEIVDGYITGKTFHSFFNPARKVCPKAQKIHGITDKYLVGKPTFKDVAPRLLDFLKDATIIIHNAPFDIAFLDQEFSTLPKIKRPKGIFPYIDTLQLTRDLFPMMDNTLDGLCKVFNIVTDTDTKQKRIHGALEDALMLAELFLKLNS